MRPSVPMSMMMIESLPWQDFLARVRFADVLDIALVAVVIFGLIRWFREGAARTAVVVVGLLVVLVAVARLLDMYLTQFLLDTLLTVAAIVLVVAFQPEIRRFLERIAAGELLRSRAPEHDVSPVADAIVSAATRMARDRVGALIAIRGREPWSHFVDGGIELDGRVSEPLLLSIFDPSSAGHDGAVLVEGDHVACFAAHLPLSKNLAEIGRRGTRHTAALGLSECCDALVVVVSEERGEVSIALGGKMVTLDSPGELKAHLDRFWRRHHAPKETSRFGASREAGYAVASITLATLFWALFAYQGEEVYRTFTAPVEFRNTPTNLAMTRNSATSVTVTIAGSPQAFRRLRPNELVAVIDLGEAKQGENQVRAEAWELDLPSGLSLYATNPADIEIDLAPRAPTP